MPRSSGSGNRTGKTPPRESTGRSHHSRKRALERQAVGDWMKNSDELHKELQKLENEK